MQLTAEALLTLPQGFALTTASPLQRAACRIATGHPLGELADHPHVIQALGGRVPAFLKHPKKPPKEIVILSGIRTGKSLFTAMLAVYWSQTANLKGLRPGEIPRISVMATDRDKATVVLNHLQGSVTASPHLKTIYVGEFKNEAIGGIILRHPSGREIEVAVVAGSRAGSSVISRWSVGIIFDEAARLSGEDDAVINLEETRKAALGRIRDGASMVYVSSPWSPTGPIYRMVSEYWGNPTEKLVILKAPGPMMNPNYWTEERVEEIKEHDPQVYRTDVLAEFANLDENLYPSDTIDACVRSEPLILPYDPNCDYVAAMDPATRGNAWPLVITTKDGNSTKIVGYYEWRGSKGVPLNPGEVIKEIAHILSTYRVDTVLTDQYSSDALRTIADIYKLHLVISPFTAANKLEMFETLRVKLVEKTIELPNDPILLKDLRLVKKRVNQNSLSITLPRTSDGRHCDGAAALALALSRTPMEKLHNGPIKGSQEYYEQWARDHLKGVVEAAQAKIRKANNPDDTIYDPEAVAWWDKDPSIDD